MYPIRLKIALRWPKTAQEAPGAPLAAQHLFLRRSRSGWASARGAWGRQDREEGWEWGRGLREAGQGGGMGGGMEGEAQRRNEELERGGS